MHLCPLKSKYEGGWGSTSQTTGDIILSFQSHKKLKVFEIGKGSEFEKKKERRRDRQTKQRRNTIKSCSRAGDTDPLSTPLSKKPQSENNKRWISARGQSVWPSVKTAGERQRAQLGNKHKWNLFSSAASDTIGSRKPTVSHRQRGELVTPPWGSSHSKRRQQQQKSLSPGWNW